MSGRDTGASNRRILVVDDDSAIVELISEALSREGFSNVSSTGTGTEAVRICRDQQPDLIVLDVMLPDMDGIEVCKRIREFSHCPVLFLSSRGDEVDRILGLAVGGDDYVTKPFSPRELVYRVKAQLRRADYAAQVSGGEVIEIGPLRIDAEGCRVFLDGCEVGLTAREFGLLLHLARNAGRILSKERLYEQVWGEDSVGIDNTMMVHIRHLREKIEADPGNPKLLVTAKGLGYKLVVPNER